VLFQQIGEVDASQQTVINREEFVIGLNPRREALFLWRLRDL
jgi:hypothetical protein